MFLPVISVRLLTCWVAPSGMSSSVTTTGKSQTQRNCPTVFVVLARSMKILMTQDCVQFDYYIGFMFEESQKDLNVTKDVVCFKIYSRIRLNHSKLFVCKGFDFAFYNKGLKH